MVIHLKTTFPLDIHARMSGVHRKQAEGRNTMHDLAVGINTMAWNAETLEIAREGEREYREILETLFYADRTLNIIQLEDMEGNRLVLGDAKHNSERIGELSFVYARINDIQFYTKTEVFLLCEYVCNGIRKTTCLVTTKERFLKLYPELSLEQGPYIICALVTRKQYSIPAKRSYNSRTHTSYVKSEDAVKYRNRILQFDILPVTEHGLHYASMEEKQQYDKLCREKTCFKKKVCSNQKNEIQIIP